MAGPEIERKYRLLQPPPAALLSEGTPILQGYVFVEDWELRLRSIGDRHSLTVKGDGTLSRKEWETEIPKWVFDTVWRKAESRAITKTRYKIAYGAFCLEVDMYGGPLLGLITLECEFPDEQTAAGFVVPSWARAAVDDVTEDKAYKNKTLAVLGMPTADHRRQVR